VDELARLKRLQFVTLVVLLATLALAVASRLERAATVAPSPSPAPAPGPIEDSIARRGIALLGSRVLALETAPPPPQGARVDASYERRVTVRITNQRTGLTAEVRDLDRAGDARSIALPGDAPRSRIVVAQDLASLGQSRHGLLIVQALVRTDNGIHEKEAHPHRLSLACIERSGTEQSLELAGCYFLAASQPDDLLLKTAANTCSFVVTDGARLELVVDTANLRAYLTEGALFEVVFRLGPLIVFEGPVTR
jgi:hypothetical protein